MAKTKTTKHKSFTFEEFEKEFYGKDTEKPARNKGALYESGQRMARESLSQIKRDSSG